MRQLQRFVKFNLLCLLKQTNAFCLVQDLASRDVVSRSITMEIREGRGVGPLKVKPIFNLSVSVKFFRFKIKMSGSRSVGSFAFGK